MYDHSCHQLNSNITTLTTPFFNASILSALSPSIASSLDMPSDINSKDDMASDKYVTKPVATVN
jgi:hypothetical protein